MDMTLSELRDLRNGLKEYYQHRKMQEKITMQEATMARLTELQKVQTAQFEELREIQASQFEDIKHMFQDVRERINRLEGTMAIFGSDSAELGYPTKMGLLEDKNK